MRVFVTGIAGFLGSHIARHLIKAGHEVSGCDNLIGGYVDNVPDDAEFFQVDCAYLNVMKKHIAGHEVVIHTACTAYEGLSVFSPHLVSQNTSQISATVFTACAANGVRRVINCSSMARYGDQGGVPFTEDMEPKPADPYGVAKLSAENLLKVLADVHDFEYVNLVPHNIIGPQQKYDDPFRNVAAIMINLMLKGSQPIIYGDGLQQRCFSDVRDILPCFEKALTSPEARGRTVNIGPDEETITIRDLAALIAEILDFRDFDPVYVDPRPQEVKVATCSADLSRELFDYKTQHSLRDSLTYMADWIRERGPRRFRYHMDLEIVSELTPKTWKERLFR